MRPELEVDEVQPEVIAFISRVLQDRTTGLHSYLLLANQLHRLIDEPHGVARLDSTGVVRVTGYRHLPLEVLDPVPQGAI